MNTSKRIEEAFDKLYDFLVPDPEGLEFGDPSYSQELSIQLDQAKSLINSLILNARIEELEKARVKVDYKDSDTVITMKAMNTYQNVTKQIAELTKAKQKYERE